MAIKGLLYAGGVNQGYNYPRYGMASSEQVCVYRKRENGDH